MRARLRHAIDELDYAFYHICCDERVLLGLLSTSLLAAVICAVAAYQSPTPARGAAWVGSLLLAVLFSHWLFRRHIPDGG